VADGGQPGGGEYFHTRQEGAFRRLPGGVDADAWWANNGHLVGCEPIETERRGLVIVSDPAPSNHPDHRPRPGVGVEHVLSEYTLRAAGIYRPDVEYPTLTGDEREWLSVRDPAERERKKERQRKRQRSRIARDGNAPQVDPAPYPEGQRWAVAAVNLIARKRYSPPEGKLTTWLTDFEPSARPIATWIFRHVAHHGGGSGLGKKYNPRTIISALLSPVFPANMRTDGDAPTPFIEGRALASLTNAYP
jgi:hypothetical protein